MFPTASRAVNTRNIFTKEYLGLAFRQRKQNEAHAKAGKNVTKIKDNFLKSYKQRGIKGLKRNDIKKPNIEETIFSSLFRNTHILIYASKVG